jgi:hypothetical protein
LLKSFLRYKITSGISPFRKGRCPTFCGAEGFLKIPLKSPFYKGGEIIKSK